MLQGSARVRYTAGSLVVHTKLCFARRKPVVIYEMSQFHTSVSVIGLVAC